MKIYEIGTGYTPIPAQVAAATESIVEELTKAFMAQNVDVEIIDICSADRAPHQLPITEVKVPSIFSRSDVRLGIVHKLKRVIYSIALASKLKKILKSTDEKIVLHFHNQYNMFFYVKLVSKKLRSKAIAVYTNHNGVWSLPLSEVKYTLKKRYFQEIIAMKKADLIFVLNTKTKKNIETYLGIGNEKIIEIRNGVNVEIYSPVQKDKVEDLKVKHNIEGKKVILQVGSINENKGQVRSLKLLEPMLRENNDLVFAYVGGVVSQKYFEELKTLICELKLEDKVFYLGAVSPGKGMNDLYNIACAMIFSSNYEGFPLVCVEALSAGIPVLLSSNVEINLGEGAIKCTAADIKSTVAQYILCDENQKELSKNARRNAVDNFVWSKISNDYVRAINQVIRTKNNFIDFGCTK